MAFTWTKISGFALTAELAYFAYNGTRYVGVIRTTNTDKYVHSTDGTTWDDTDVLPTSINRSGLIWGDAAGLFVATAEAATDAYVTSPDGLAWTVRTLPASITQGALSFANGEFIVCDDASTTAYRSTDGIAWTSFTTKQDLLGQVRQIAYGGGVHIAAHESGYAISSDDMATWTTTEVFVPNRGIAYAKFTFVRTEASNGCFYSEDLGATWTASTVTGLDEFDSVTWYTLMFAGNHFFALAEVNGLREVFSSDTGMVWERETDITAADCNAGYNVGGGGTIGGELFVHGIFDGLYKATLVTLEPATVAVAATINASDALSSLTTTFLADEVDMSEALAAQDIANLRDVADAVIDGVTAAQLSNSLSALLEASEELRQLVYGVLSDSVDASEALASFYTQLELLRARAHAADPLLTSQTADMLLLAAATAIDRIAVGYDAALADSSDATELLADILRANAQLLAEADADAALTNSIIFSASLEDAADVDDALDAAAQFVAFLDADGEASVYLRLAGEDYTAWVLNLDNIAVTEYRNYEFNSFADFNGTYYGAADDGLYTLGGDTDAGDAIPAWIRTGLTNYGTGAVKRMPMMYVGYTAANGLVLKVAVTDKGVKTEHWFRLEARTASATRADRAKVGKGLAAVYWQWELHNIAGGDFDIDTLRLWPMVLSRRVR